MKIAIASDHAGFELKQKLIGHLKAITGAEPLDMGTSSLAPVDYPDLAHKLAANITSGKVQRGVLICGSGIGMCMAANRHKGVRAAVLHDRFSAEMSRRHNDCNVACLGARNIAFDAACELLSVWLGTAFEGGRHAQRVGKIEESA